MPTQVHLSAGAITERLRGIVDRVTYHNPDNGWSVLRVFPFDNPGQQETVTVHQTKVFAGATMEFEGAWVFHPRHGRQFNAAKAVELKPASAAALEKYLGSGLIRGVGPKTAKKIVRHFGEKTLEVFEGEIQRLVEVPGIAHRKLETIRCAWAEHRAVRDVMMFLQAQGISTLFAVRIFKEYGDRAIALVQENPYRLANDIYGIGFFTADKVALSMGLDADSDARFMAAVRHVLAASRDFGHCYLTHAQIHAQVLELIARDPGERLPGLLERMQQEGLLMAREVHREGRPPEPGYYSRSLYFDELCVAQKIARMQAPVAQDRPRVAAWIARYCRRRGLVLSEQQAAAVEGIVGERVSILTGGPGCGKTTTTRVLVRLLEAMQRRVLLAAPTGRAAQRMAEVIGREARTIHRLLEWQVGKFKRGEEFPLDVDFLVVDECSMLDISLTASLLKAVPAGAQLLLIGDADQLPSVGAGNVLRDLIASRAVATFTLTQVFRQARESLIIRYAHQINAGEMPRIDSPFKEPELWRRGVDCLFIDSDEATREQIQFIGRVKRLHASKSGGPAAAPEADPYLFRTDEPVKPYESELSIPNKFRHVDLEALCRAGTPVEELMAVLNRVHPWSSLHYGLSALDAVRKLYLEWVPRYFGADMEIQIITPMTRGSLGTVNLNRTIQESANPAQKGKAELRVGDRVFRVGDRVIHRRNNYDLGVFNGDIGVIREIDNAELECRVAFMPDGREVGYRRDDIPELDLAYAITIHKSQGSEFGAVIIPILTQHFKMLFRNLVYTGLTRARRLAVVLGTRKALALAVRNQDTRQRQTYLKELLQ
jgi:exodeoxyribonuclease V alpha subunit